MCGIFGIFGHPKASELTFLGLHALQHRGQESAGISVSDGETIHTRRDRGWSVKSFPVMNTWNSKGIRPSDMSVIQQLETVDF